MRLGLPDYNQLMLRILLNFVLLLIAIGLPAMAQEPGSPPAPSSGHYLFAWSGDVDGKGNDFLAVIDAEPSSPSYGQLVTTLDTDQRSMQVHHTEYSMPAYSLVVLADKDRVLVTGYEEHSANPHGVVFSR
jgi:hypothetical protein